MHYEVIEKVGGNESRLSELGWLLGAYGYCLVHAQHLGPNRAATTCATIATTRVLARWQWGVIGGALILIGQFEELSWH